MRVKVKNLKPNMICMISEPTVPDERVKVDQAPEKCNCRQGFEMDKFDLYVNDEIKPRHFDPDFEVRVVR